MKNFKNISQKLVVRIGAVCIVSLLLSSCIKGHDDTPATPSSFLTVLQESPGQPTLDFTLNGSRVNATGIAFGNGLDYFKAFSGQRTAAFVKTGTATAIFSDTLTLTENYAYTLLLVGKTDNPGFMLLKDSIAKPTSGNANLRFINVSPDAPAVDLAVKDGAVLVSNKAFKGFSSFAPITSKTYTFEIRQAGTSTVLATIPNVSVNPGFVYTLYFRGLKDATDANKLTADLITNAAY